MVFNRPPALPPSLPQVVSVELEELVREQRKEEENQRHAAATMLALKDPAERNRRAARCAAIYKEVFLAVIGKLPDIESTKQGPCALLHNLATHCCWSAPFMTLLTVGVVVVVVVVVDVVVGDGDGVVAGRFRE